MSGASRSSPGQADVEGAAAALNDRELWRRASEGETEAFGRLFDRHAKAVYNFLFRRTTSWSDAEDLTSLVFLHAWRRREEVVLVHESALPWLLRTADYVVRNERRRQHFRWATVLKHPPTADEPDLADGSNQPLPAPRSHPSMNITNSGCRTGFDSA